MSHRDASQSLSALLARLNPKVWDSFLDEFERPTCTRYVLESLEKCPSLRGSANVFAHRDYVRKNPPQMLYDEYRKSTGLAGLDLPKCNVRAAELRLEGNKFVAKKMYREAMVKYNESICAARSDSEDLGIAFANRSAVYYEEHEYEFSLSNIKLARQHNYPQRLMAKLELRERNCKEKIAAKENEWPNRRPKFVVNVEVNPSIPFLAKGVTTGEFARFGRGMKAEKDFRVGDIILHERPAVVADNPTPKCQACYHCGSENFQSLIPCPHCVSVMFCNEECAKNGWKEFHRFVCGIYDKLSSILFVPNFAGLKMFFYGLSQFNDNVENMMEYCKDNDRKGNNPFDLDWTRSNPMETFKQFHTAKVSLPSEAITNFGRTLAALFYEICLEQSLVRSLFVSEQQRDFLLQSIDDYMLHAGRMAIGGLKTSNAPLFTFASVCNHSCDPNAHAFYSFGELKLVVVRPISKGDQICIDYAIKSNQPRAMQTMTNFECVCEACDRTSATKQSNNEGIRKPVPFLQHLGTVNQILADPSCTYEESGNAAQQFLQRYGQLYQLDEFHMILAAYQDMLQLMIVAEMHAQLRQLALAAI